MFNGDNMQIIEQEISIKGNMVRVPAIQVDDYIVIVTGQAIKVAEIYDEYWLERKCMPDPVNTLNIIQESPLKADLFTFTQRVPDTEPRYAYPLEWDNYAVIPLSTYEEWLNKQISSMTRRNITASQKRGIEVRVSPYDDDYVKGIMSIYNETPIRQGRKFWHYGKEYSSVYKENGTYSERSIFLSAHYDNSMIGYMKVVLDESTAAIMQILSKIAYYDKRPNNALMATAVKECCKRNIKYLIYEKYIYGKKADSSLTEYKRSNGFIRMDVPRYYVPLSAKGKIAFRMGLHRNIKEKLPYWLMSKLIYVRTRWNERARVTKCAT